MWSVRIKLSQHSWTEALAELGNKYTISGRKVFKSGWGSANYMWSVRIKLSQPSWTGALAELGNSGHFVPLQCLRAAHTLRSDQCFVGQNIFFRLCPHDIKFAPPFHVLICLQPTSNPEFQMGQIFIGKICASKHINLDKPNLGQSSKNHPKS